MKLQKRIVYPSKTTLNLVIRERTMNSPSRVFPVFLLLLALIALFVRFAVLSPMEKAYTAEARADNIAVDLTTIRLTTSGYNDLLAEYGRYTYGGMSEEELALVDRLELLALVEGGILPRAQVHGMVVSGNVLTLQLSGATLNEMSAIMLALYSYPIVQNVSVSTVSTNPDDPAQVTAATMTILLAQEGGDAA